MKKSNRLVSILLLFSMLLSTLSSAYATYDIESYDDNVLDTYLEVIEDGYLFVQQTDKKSVAIATNDTNHIITVSIKYTASPDTVYQWIIDDYSATPPYPDTPSFWANVTSYAEERIDEAFLVIFSVKDINENDSMVISSAVADLSEDMEDIVGREFSDRYIEYKKIEGHEYRMYETLEFNIKKVKVLSWRDGITLGTLIVAVLGLSTSGTVVSTICGVLGIASIPITEVIPAGSMNKYDCMAFYTRYVTVDYSNREYSYSYKVRDFEGFEDAAPNSRGRAYVISESEQLYYSTTKDYYYNGLFDEAYKVYNNLDL